MSNIAHQSGKAYVCDGTKQNLFELCLPSDDILDPPFHSENYMQILPEVQATF